MPGFYNLESDDRSVINKLNTNYFCFCILVKDINKVLISETKGFTHKFKFYKHWKYYSSKIGLKGNVCLWN